MTFFTKSKKESAVECADRTSDHSFRQILVSLKQGKGGYFLKNGMKVIPFWNGSKTVGVSNFISMQRQFINEIPIQLAVPVAGAAD